MPVRVHINGLTRPEDAAAAAAAGVEGFGIFFWPQSSSSVTIAQAQAIVAALPPDALTMGLFVDAMARVVDRTLERTGIALPVFAGSEDEEYCRPFAGRYAKVIRLRSLASLENFSRFDCPFFVLDGEPAVQGGAREIPFDFNLARRARRLGRIVVSGGINLDNVTEVITTCRPWAVEVSAGVESSQGIKDARKIQRLVEICKSL